jgi:cell shape-determining protein MreC
MPNIRFSHVFAGLMLLSFLSAFVLPARGTGALQTHLHGLFTWVSKPVHWASGEVEERWKARTSEDPRSAAALRRENAALLVAVVNLNEQLTALRRLNQERDRVGSVRELSIPAEVMGGDSGMMDSIALGVTSRDGVAKEQIVVYPGGIVGRVNEVGLSGTQVRLVTASRFRLLAGFGRYQRNGDRLEFVRVPLAPQVIEGIGGGQMTIPNLTMKAVKESGLAEGDWAVVMDAEWPMAVQGYRVATVKKISQGRAALFAEVMLVPETNLMGLREVMVITKG